MTSQHTELTLDFVRNKCSINNIICYGILLSYEDFEIIFNNNKEYYIHNDDDNDDNNDDIHDNDDKICDEFYDLNIPNELYNKVLSKCRIDHETSEYIRSKNNKISKISSNKSYLLIGIDFKYISVAYDGIITIPSIDYVIENFRDEIDILNNIINILNNKYNIKKTASLISYCT